MPDGDVISRGIRWAWRPAYEGIQAHAPATIVASRVAKAVARSLRTTGGVPAFNRVVDLVRQRQDGRLSDQDLASGLRRLRREDRLVTHTIIHAATRCAALLPPGADTQKALASTIVHELARVELFDKARVSLVEDQLADADGADAYVAECVDASKVDLGKLADQLARSPTSSRFRAPAHRQPRVSTADLLNRSIL